MLTRTPRRLAGLLAALVLAQAGCSTLVHDARVSPLPPQAKHCEGSEVNTSTHIAVLPIPIVAFFVPRITTNAPDSSRFLGKCGGQRQVNRRVEVNYGPCVPTLFLTTVVTLGIVGVCPTLVSYEADILD